MSYRALIWSIDRASLFGLVAMIQKVIRIAQPVFLVIAALAIVFFLYSQWDTLRSYPWRIMPGLMLLSMGMMLLTWAVEVEIWRRILSRVNGRLPYVPAVRIWFLSAILRYIPGNIWQPLSMTVYCTRYGIRPEITITSIFLYQVIILLAVAPFVALYMWFGTLSGYLTSALAGASPWLILLLLLPVIVFIVRPNWLISLLNAILIKFRRTPMEARLTSGVLLALILAAVGNWVMWGVTFALFTISIVDMSGTDLPQLFLFLIVSYPIAYAVGFISLITPSGFGVREGAFLLLLSPMMAGSVVAVAALAMRALTAIGELIMALISAPFERESTDANTHAEAILSTPHMATTDTDASNP